MYFNRLPPPAARDDGSKALEGRFWLGKHADTGQVRLHKSFKILAWDVLESADDAAVSDLEFQRELSPEQIREALSLLDGTAGAQDQNLRIGDLSPGEEVNLEPDQSSTTMAAQDRLLRQKTPSSVRSI